jgi:hypothetical protein
MFAIDMIGEEVNSDEKEAIESPEQKGGDAKLESAAQRSEFAERRRSHCLTSRLLQR